MLRLRRLLAVACLPFVLAAASCGSDDSSGGGSGGDGGGAGTGGPGPFGERVPVSETRNIEGLTGPVDAVRDEYGMVHIYGTNIEDVVRVQGWMMAADRSGQLELARRFATGRVSEILGAVDSSFISTDISFRTIGLHRAAQQMYDALEEGSEAKRVLDAFSDGITQWNRALRDGKVRLPPDMAGLQSADFTDWSPVDTLAMGRLQTWNLSYDEGADIGLSERFAAVRSTFDSSSSDPLVAKRAGLLIDTMRFAPIDPAKHMDGFPDDAFQAYRKPGDPLKVGFGDDPVKAMNLGRPPAWSRAPKGLYDSVRRFHESLTKVHDIFSGDEFAGSNNWAVAGSQTSTGNAMIANDPHLGLDSPMVFWPTHIVVEGDDPIEAAGLAFPGIPGVILGANRKVAWAATTAAFDVTDVWLETISSDGDGVMFRGEKVAFERVPETLKVFGRDDYTWDVLVVPHHGPIAPTLDIDQKVVPPEAGGNAFSVRWTGHQPTGEVESVIRFLRAQDVDDMRAALQTWGTGAQNWMFADTAGDIFLFSAGNLPYRDQRAYTWDAQTYQGQLPCLVLDGESGEHEWTGDFLEERYVPKAKTPARGFLFTANGDHVGTTLDNDPSNDMLPNGESFYLGCDFAVGLRAGRIEERLEQVAGNVTPDDLASIQADVKSGLGSRLAPALVAALERAEAERQTGGTHADLTDIVADSRYAAADVPALIDALKKWGSEHDYEAAAGVNLDDNSLSVDAAEKDASFATLVFNAWLVRVLAHTFGDEAAAAGIGNFGSSYTIRAFVRLVSEDPMNLATYDAATGESAIWDDMSTASVVESRDERFVRALLDGLDGIADRLGTDRSEWAWGRLHSISFDPLVPLWTLTIPPSSDPVFGGGFPRHGDMYAVDASNYGFVRGLNSNFNFRYGSGPVQRFVAEMTPDGPVIRNALPGGAVARSDSEFFANEAEFWRKNENHPVFVDIDDVAESAGKVGTHIVFSP